MKRRKKPPASATLTELEKAEATLLALHGLCAFKTEGEIKAEIRENFSCSPHAAAAVLRRAERRFVEAAERTAGEARAMWERQVDHLYRTAFAARDFATCRDLLKTRARVWGFEAPQRIKHEGSVSFTDGRSVEELEHYALHGYFPDESPDPEPETEDPLPRLH